MLIVRAWIEKTPADAALRARITQVLDVSSGTKVETAATSQEEILRAVEEWLAALAGRPVTER